MTVALTVNGKPRELEEPTPLPDFLARLELGPRPIAVGYNGEVVHKEAWPTITLRAGDTLDIVHMVGGG